MDFSIFTQFYELLYAMGELLIQTWPGRVFLGVAIGSVIAWLARL